MLSTIIWFIAVIVIMPILLLGWCHYAEKPKSYLATYDEAKKSQSNYIPMVRRSLIVTVGKVFNNYAQHAPSGQGRYTPETEQPC